VEAADSADCEWVYRFVRNRGIPFHIIGAGSNLIVPDSGVRGVVLKTRSERACIDFAGNGIVIADSGVYLETLIREAAAKGKGGFEHVTGIPGTVGGAVVMNAGTREGDTSGILEYAEVITSACKVIRLESEELAFGYRHSLFQGCDWLILRAAFRLREADPETTLSYITDVWSERENKFPLEYPSAGSVFKRPPGDFAGRLIEEAGCKGLRIGGAEVSVKHANFIVNSGDAKSEDIIELISEVRRQVYRNSGIYLELEQEILEDFE
jgi:UDP-N-acetylmuramate dehydrogenase